MLQIRVLFGFTNAHCQAVEETAKFVLAGLTCNPDYPVKPDVIAALQTALTEFSCLIVLASNGGRRERIEMNKKRNLLVQLLEYLAGFVEAHCHNDLATLLSSGFSAVITHPSRVSSEPFKTGEPAQNTGDLTESAAA